ncbi:hypothetical protein, partial [Streptomyces mutabilis]|uniref:hypothetical protein n=1 Tax=Streptomyces mutabilis TaxID=67332 RepID=UPI00369EA9E0
EQDSHIKADPRGNSASTRMPKNCFRRKPKLDAQSLEKAHAEECITDEGLRGQGSIEETVTEPGRK